jgi:hypothetical protein
MRNLSRPGGVIQLVGGFMGASAGKMLRRLTGMAVLFMLAALLLGQSGRARRNGGQISPGTPDAYKGVAVTFRGKLKNLDKKQVVIETDEDQTVSMRITSKTKFLKNDQTIKASQIDLGTPVSIDATEDTDLSILALSVVVDSPPKKNNAK